MTNSEISIVMPVYDIEPTILKDSINSVLHQDNVRLQLIAVDDGSSKPTQNVLEGFKERYGESFHLIRQANQGGAVALNTGLAAATGKYIAFCDYDDWMFPGALQHLLSLATSTDAEVVMGRIQRFCGDFGVWGPIDNFLSENRLISDLNADERLFFASAYWGKLFKKSHLDKHEIVFDNKYVADIPFVHKSYFHATKIAVSNQLVHLWRRNSNSISFFETGYKDYIDIFDEMITYIDRKNIDVNKKHISIKYLLSIVWKYPEISENQRLTSYLEEKLPNILQRVFTDSQEIDDLKYFTPPQKQTIKQFFKVDLLSAPKDTSAESPNETTANNPARPSTNFSNGDHMLITDIEKISVRNPFPRNLEEIRRFSAENFLTDYENLISPLTPPHQFASLIRQSIVQDKPYRTPYTGRELLKCFYKIETNTLLEKFYTQAKMNALLNKRVYFKQVGEDIICKEAAPDETIDICMCIWIDRLVLRSADRDKFLVNVIAAAFEMGLSIVPWITAGINTVANVPNATLHILPHTTGNKGHRYAHYKTAYLPDFRYFENEGYAAWSEAGTFMENLQPSADITAEAKALLYEKYKKNKISRLNQRGDLEIPKAQRFVFVALQVPDDTVAQFAYFDIFDAIQILSAFYQDKDCKILVKKHPLDNRESTEQNLEKVLDLPNVHLVQGNIHRYIEECEYVLTVNSGVGIEALLYEKPVITIGDSDYKDATINIRSTEELKQRLLEGNFEASKKEIQDFLEKFFSIGVVNVNSPKSVKNRLELLYKRAVASEEPPLFEVQTGDIGTPSKAELTDLFFSLKKKGANFTILEVLNQMRFTPRQYSAAKFANEQKMLTKNHRERRRSKGILSFASAALKKLR